MLSHFSHTFRTRIEFLQMKAQSSLLSIYNPPNHHFLHTTISHFPKTTKNNHRNMTCKIHSPQSNPLSQFYDPFATLRRPPDFQIRIPIDTNWPEKVSVSDIWSTMRHEARLDVEKEPVLSEYYSASILSHDTMESALSDVLSTKLGDRDLPRGTLRELFMGVMGQDEEIIWAVGCDLVAVKERDPACMSYVHCFLNFKGFLACQAHRIAHRLWSQGRKTLALIIQSRVSESFAVDIHPGARIGRGILLDHATGLVVGETAVVGDDVAILHNVTLGGTGKMCGDRHPKIGDGVLIGAGTCVLGNVRIGEGAKVGAGSVVLKEVPPRTTAVGNPARLIGGRENPVRLDEMPSLTMDHTSDISEWSDYVI